VTVLCGDPTFSAYTPVGPSGSDGAYLAPIPFVAPSSGTVSTLYCYLNPASTQQFVMALYDAVLQLLVYSAPITVAPNAGLTAFPVNPTPVVASQAYQIVLFPQGTGSFQFGTDTASVANAYRSVGSNASFPIPPINLTAGSPINYAAPTFFADGDAQGQVISPSGVIGQDFLTTSHLIERAFNRCRIRSSLISDEMLLIAREELLMFLTSDLSNRGPQLFAVDIQVLPFTAHLANVQMPAGTIDVLNANLRQQSPLQSSPSPVFTATTPVRVNTVGITWAGPAVPVQVWADSKLVASAQPNASAGQTTLIDLDGAPPALTWSVVADPVPPNPLSAGSLVISNVNFYQTLFQVPLAPYSRDDFANLNNTFFEGRPFQYWLDRQEPWPIMRLWPTPGVFDALNSCLVIWRQRQIMDIGDLNQRLDIPHRWITAVVDGLAARLAYAIQEVNPALIPALEAKAEKSLNLARMEERENAPMRIVPQIYRYTK
jgi:hypothetical protein